MKYRNLCLRYLLIILLSLFTRRFAKASKYNLEIVQTIQNCYGGQVCSVQPIINVIDGSSARVFTINGYACIALGSTPTGFEQMYFSSNGTDCDYKDECGEVVVSIGCNTMVSIVDGLATFENLLFKTAGSGYTLKITAYYSNLQPFAYIISEPFNVTVGKAFKLTFLESIGGATGGLPFSSNPIIQVVDRGNNLIDYLFGSMNASLVKKPSGNFQSELFPVNGATALIRYGIAKFSGLYINGAGYPYVIAFESFIKDYDLPVLQSEPFTVAVGPVSQLKFVNSLNDTTSVLAGEYFSLNPEILLLDKGGNQVTYDSTSVIVARIVRNPSYGKLSSSLPFDTFRALKVSKKSYQQSIDLSDALYSYVLRGKCYFTSFKIDKIGIDYQIGYFLYELIPSLNQSYTETSVVSYSVLFDVVYGPPRNLVTITQAGVAFSGGKPFLTQPIVGVVDYGGNLIQSIQNSIATVSLVTSPGTNNIIRIDTNPETALKYQTNQVSYVSSDLNNISVGAGQYINIFIHFTYELWIVEPSSIKLSLSIRNAFENTTIGYADLVNNYLSRQSMLIFRYIVKFGDFIHNGEYLDYVNKHSLIISSSSSIFDANNKSINSLLPEPSNLQTNYEIKIDTSIPVITNFDINTTAGEYGAGQVILFQITYNLPVSVAGVPYLLLAGVNSDNNTLIAQYNFSSNSSRTLNFCYEVCDGDSTYGWNLNVSDTFIQLDYSILNSGDKYSAYEDIDITILRDSTIPTTPANLNFTQNYEFYESSVGNIVINTDPPILDVGYGIKTDHDDGVFYSGEVIYISVKFNRPIYMSGQGLTIIMNAGDMSNQNDLQPFATYGFFYRLDTDNQTVVFKYEIPISDRVKSDSLNIMGGGKSIFIPKLSDTKILRLSTHPITPVSINTTFITPLFYQRGGYPSSIITFGRRQSVSSISLFHVNPINSTFFPDDKILISVTFEGPAVSTCPGGPVLRLDVKYQEEAVYVQGNGSSRFIFQYTVAIGDESDGLYASYYPNALCVASGCPKQNDCGLFSAATNPIMPFHLSLPKIPGYYSKSKGVAIDTGIYINPVNLNRNTTIISINCSLNSSVYTAGTVMHMFVVFTDLVFVQSIDVLPSLYLNIESYATYSGGSNSDTLMFTYITTQNDFTYDLLPAAVNGTESPIRCLEVQDCFITNRINENVDLNTSNSIIDFSHIVLLTIIPKILNITINLQNRHVSDGYSLGTQIELSVVYDQPVIVFGPKPFLRLTFSANNYYESDYRDIMYCGIDSTHLILKFCYTVVSGDYTSRLKFYGSFIYLNNGFTKIYAKSDIPEILADSNFSLIDYPQQANTGLESNIGINSDILPSVISVTPVNLVNKNISSYQRTYHVGDSLIFEVKLSHAVISTGISYINLNVGNNIGRAYLFEYNKSFPVLPTNESDILYFKYVVQPYDYTYRLEYVDEYSLFPGLDVYNSSQGYFLSAITADYPIQLVLPKPGTVGSISLYNSIYINGYPPYLIDFSFVNTSKVYYIGETIYMRMNFSEPVIVKGNPFIVLNTLKFRRYAYYYPISTMNSFDSILFSGVDNAIGCRSIYFRYIIQPGDDNLQLDYYVDSQSYFSSAGSFVENGGGIYTYSDNPSQLVQIHLNPSGGYLSGTESVNITSGSYLYFDIGISNAGSDYQLRYTSYFHDILAVFPNLINIYNHQTVLTTTQNIFVAFSNEYELKPAESKFGAKLVGLDVAIFDDIIVLGAPETNVTTFTQQSITTSISTYSGIVSQPEIQIIETEISPQPYIQQFYTTADVDARVGGNFRISWGEEGTSRLIPCNVDGDMLNAILNYDFPTLGFVNVTRDSNIYCACYNAYIWTLTFVDLVYGVYDPLIFHNSALTGSNADVVGPKILQLPAYLIGTFQLKTSDFGLTTSPIQYNANQFEMLAAMTEIGLAVQTIDMAPIAASNALSWIITFGVHNGSYEVPKLIGNASGLSGGNDISVWCSVLQQGLNGPEGISGHFALEWRNETTGLLPSNASATEVATALESLPVIGQVNVERISTYLPGCYTWLIEFVIVYELTITGYVVDTSGTIEYLIPHNHLHGTNTSITVAYTQYGDYGSYAGTIYVYQLVLGNWYEVAALIGTDTSTNDRFGTSVDINQDIIIVGAPYARQRAVPAIQTLHCSATSAYFVLSFGGYNSPVLSGDLQYNQFVSLMDNTFYDLTMLHISPWTISSSSQSLCSNNSFNITFTSPNPSQILFTLEILNVTASWMKSSSSALTLTLAQNETFVSQSEPEGAVYIFRANYNCPVDTTAVCFKNDWVQEARFSPSTSYGSEQFGFDVALSDNLVAIIGSPGSFNGVGSVYIYEYSLSLSSWLFLQEIENPNVIVGGKFGYSVDISSNSIIIGSPFVDDNTGNVLAYQRQSDLVSVFTQAQSVSEAFLLTLKPGDMFGFSVAIDENTFVVGAPGSSDSLIVDGDEFESVLVGSGRVYVFTRALSYIQFEFFQLLVPSNIRSQDRFGFDVDIDGNVLIATALEDYTGDAVLSGVIIRIMTTCSDNSTELSGSFKLKWLNYTTATNVFSDAFSNNVGSTVATSYINGNYLETSSNSINFVGSATKEWTRSIPYDATATEMQVILEEDLSMRGILISRLVTDSYIRAYAWYVTFIDQGDVDIPLFQYDTTELGGTDAQILVSYQNPNPPFLRGLSHVFYRNGQNELFSEELLIFPSVFQPNDRCGSSVAVSGLTSVIGCPNRDENLPSINAGSGFVYDMNILGLKLANIRNETSINSELTATVYEGLNYTVIVNRRGGLPLTDENVYFYIQTFDRNSNISFQQYIKRLYGLKSSIPYPFTSLDYTGLAGSAVARSQSYGSYMQTSEWVDGEYDYRAISDYAPLYGAYIFTNRTESGMTRDNITAVIETTQDYMLELPNENFTVGLVSPGMFPSPLGRLFMSVNILDNNTGIIDDIQLYSKLYNPHQSDCTNNRLGSVVRVLPNLVMLSSAPFSQNNQGEVMQYTYIDSRWQLQGILRSPDYNGSTNTNTYANRFFGDDIALTRLDNSDTILCAISEPQISKVHIYVAYLDSIPSNVTLHNNGTLIQSASTNITFTFDITLSTDDITLSQQNFGVSGTLALNNNVLVVGAPGNEAVYLFYRKYNSHSTMWEWTSALRLRSSDFDYDYIYLSIYLHQQNFGSSASLSSRTLVVGAPNADYDKLGTNEVEVNLDTQGASISTYGKGKVYTFYSPPSKQQISIYCNQYVYSGNFKLGFNNSGIYDETILINITNNGQDLQAFEMKNTLEMMRNIGYVNVEYNFTQLSNSTYLYSWIITFLSEYQDPDLFLPIWYGSGCSACQPINANSTRDIITDSVIDDFVEVFFNISVAKVASYQDFQQIQILSPDTRRNGDRFGYSLSLDHNQLIIGSPYAAGIVYTTWDFETGDLSGWSATGSSFQYQPTFGDNCYYRETQSSTSQLPSGALRHVGGIRRLQSEKSGIQGRYFIGTYEKRPGSKEDYKYPDSKYQSGEAQGNEPQGTLTSEVFIIFGTTISFLIGGGCDINSEYIELVVDSVSVAKATGSCQETMTQQQFNVTYFQYRAAYLRIVDISSSTWGHINIDQISFDWDIHGGSQPQVNKAVLTAGQVETPHSGVSYIYSRLTRIFGETCPDSNQLSCEFVLMSVLMPSDKRRDMLFGSAVSIDEASGLAAVGTPGAAQTGFYKEVMQVYPYQNPSTGLSDTQGLVFPILSSFQEEFLAQPFHTAVESGSQGVWLRENATNVVPDVRLWRSSGAVYLFTSLPAVKAVSGEFLQRLHWNPIETAKIQAFDANLNDEFGTSLDIKGTTLAIGSPNHGHDGIMDNAGSIYVYNTAFANVKFTQVEYEVIENYVVGYIAVTIVRTITSNTNKVILHYATSDITATGVDSIKFDSCLKLPTSARYSANCGDYELSQGVVIIHENEQSTGFSVRIMDNLCKNRYYRYIQITLSVPGSGPLQGREMMSRIRIDDDDTGYPNCF